MLGGLAPVVVFVFPPVNSKDLLKKIGVDIKDNSIFDFDLPLVPVPFYLDETLTGIAVDDHERSINIEFETDGEGNNFEREISSDVRLTVVAAKGNVAFQAFLALFEQVLKRVPSQAYKVMLFYDDVFLTNASLKDFATSTRENTDTRVVNFTLTSRSEKSKAIAAILKNAGDSLKEFFK